MLFRLTMEEFRKMKQEQQKQSTSWRPKGFIQWLLTILTVITFSFISIQTYYIWEPSDLSGNAIFSLS